MIIFSKSFAGGAYKLNGPDDAVYAKSESGWIDSELFMVSSIVAHSVQCCYLLMDMLATSRLTSSISHVRIKLYSSVFPPHTTHALQPLDVSVFKSLKSHFSKALSFAKNDFVVSKREFARVVKTHFEKAFSISNIKAGFAKCAF